MPIVHCKTLRPGDFIRGLSRPHGSPEARWVEVEAVDPRLPRGGSGVVTLTEASAKADDRPRTFEWGRGYVWVSRKARGDE